jgi:DNA-directed RNA polymerase alpha subunit
MIDRNEEIFWERIVYAKTYTQLSAEYDLSMARLRQIVEKQRRKFSRKLKELESLKEIAIIASSSHMKTVKKINSVFNISDDEVDGEAMKIDNLDFSVRTRNCLKSEGIDNISDLMNYSDKDLLRIPNFGKYSLNEIKEKLEVFENES